MALPDIQYVDVALPNGNTFPVRGLSLPDVSNLINSHRDVLQGYFEKYMKDRQAGRTPKVLPPNPAELGGELLTNAPILAAKIIALAADDAENTSKAARLPMTTQIEALEKIAALTFEAEGGPKKFAEAVIRLIQGTTNLMTDLNRSQIGSLVSDAK